MTTITVNVLHNVTGIGLSDRSIVLCDMKTINHPGASANIAERAFQISKIYQTGIPLGSSINPGMISYQGRASKARF